MKWFNNLSIRNKLMVGFGLILVCLGIVIVTAYTAVKSITDVQSILFHVEFPHTVELIKFRNALSQDRMLLTRGLNAETPLQEEEILKELGQMDQRIQEHWDRITTLSREIPGMENDVRKLASVLQDYQKARNTQGIPFIKERKKDEAQALMAIQFDRYEKMMEMCFNLSKTSEAHDKELMARSEHIAQKSNLIVGVVGLIGIFLSVAVTLSMLRSVAKPLKDLSAMTEQVAYGDLGVDFVAEKRDDEVGSLQFMFGMMVSSLRQITIEIRSVIDTLSEKVLSDENVREHGAASTELQELAQKLKKLIEEYKV